MPVITPIDIEPIFHLDLGNNNEPWVIETIERAQEMVEGELGRPIEEATGIVETIHGSWRSLLLSRWPVATITTLKEDGITLADGEYRLDPETGIIWRLASGYPTRWMATPGGVEVTYNAGFPTTHRGYKELAGVVARVAVRMFEAAAAFAAKPDGTDGLSQEQLGSYSVTYSKDPAPLGQTESVANAFMLTDEDRATIKSWRA